MGNWLARVNRSLGVGGYVAAISLVAAMLLAAPLFALAAAGNQLGRSRSAWRPRRHSRHRRRGRAGQSRGQPRLRSNAAAGSGTARRGSLASAHARRRADIADDAGGHRGANRAVGDPSPREPRGRSAFRAGFRLDRLARPNTPRATRRSSPRRRKASRVSIGAMARRRAAPAFCSCIAVASGTKANRGGSAGSASAASCTN